MKNMSLLFKWCCRLVKVLFMLVKRVLKILYSIVELEHSIDELKLLK